MNIIGVDGGATKVHAGLIDANPDQTFTLTHLQSKRYYQDYPEFDSSFTPVGIEIQLNENKNDKVYPTVPEVNQSKAYIRAIADVIKDLHIQLNNIIPIVGIGMPGLKTSDQRGISVLANGPRMPGLLDDLQILLTDYGIQLKHPILHLGSDADHCGLGEEYGNNGLFKSVKNAYYIGGGTGIADALKLNNKLIPFDEAKEWIAKTWELKGENNLSLEKYISGSGIQSIYSQLTNIPLNDLAKEKIYPDSIFELAINGDPNATETFHIVATNLANLIYERITTLYCGWQSLFEFVNNKKKPLNKKHPFLKNIFDHIVIGQRLGDVINRSRDSHILWKPFLTELTQLIIKGDISDELKERYISNGNIRESIFRISNLKEAPVLGAGISAYLDHDMYGIISK